MSVPVISENIPDISGFVPVISEKRSCYFRICSRWFLTSDDLF